jgi:DNA-binding MarR family transcriptional regulator
LSFVSFPETCPGAARAVKTEHPADFVDARRLPAWQHAGMDDVDRDAAPSAEPGLSYAIARLQQLVLGAVSEISARHHLTALQFTTLSVLNRHGTPLSSSQLARRSFMTAQSMHEVTHRLEETGLIKRNPHPSHRRKLPASLTAKGRRVVTACEAAVADFETRMLRGFSRAERARFLAMIKAAVRNLGGGFGGSVHPGDDHHRAAVPARTKRAPSKRAA